MIYAACVAGGVIAAFLLVFTVVAVQNKRARKRRAKTRNKDSPQSGRKMEFSKYIVHAFLVPYFFGVGAGFYIVLKDTPQLGVWLAFVGTPVATAAGFYFWKAKAENIVKIKRENPAETEGVPVDLNNITP